jgi:hypothetical protein
VDNSAQVHATQQHVHARVRVSRTARRAQLFLSSS